MSSKIASFNPTTLKQVRADLEQMFNEYANRTGVAIKVGRIGFDANSFTAKITAATVTSDSETTPVAAKNQVERAAWNKHSKSFGLDAGMLDKTFEYGSTKYTILGLMPNRRKYPVLVYNHKVGKNQLAPVDSVKAWRPAAS